MTEKMLGRRDGAIGHMIFNQPEKRNAVCLAMWERATEILDEFEADPAIRVVVLSGAGGKAFVSGADISEFEDQRGTAEAQQHYNAQTGEGLRAHRAVPEADHRHDRRLLHRRRAESRLRLRYPHLLGQVAVRHAGGAAGARLSLRGDQAAERTSSASPMPGT